MRTLSDYWVVCRKSGHRRFFVVLNQKSANFAEINGEIETLHSLIERSVHSPSNNAHLHTHTHTHTHTQRMSDDYVKRNLQISSFWTD